MTQYIDKAAIVAEIESLLDKGRYHEEYDCAYRDGNNGALYALKNKIDSLEVKEFDFEDTKSVFDGQYLSKDKVVTTIERLQDECEEQGNNNGVELLEKLFNKLDTIEVKEVDLDFQTFAKEMKSVFSLPSPKTENIEEEPLNWEYAIAKHFYELGFKSQKEE